MNKEEFHKQAQSAIGDGARARDDLARAQAKQFLTGSTDFRPQDLQRLGSKGLRQFLRLINRADLTTNPSPAATNKKVENSVTPENKQHGWSSQRRSEPVWILRAIFYGVVVALPLLAVSITALNFIDIGANS